MIVHIKTEDLCERCIFSFELHCSAKMHGNCTGCVMDETGRPGGCKCLTVRRNTPCPYFEEDKP